LQGFCCIQRKVIKLCILLGCVAASYVSRQCSDLILRAKLFKKASF
jgi:hypothetical protein